MLKIADLVTLDDKAEFRSDVQLDAYDLPKQNLALLRSYLFSSAIPTRAMAATRDISAVGLLKVLVDIYLNERNINRLALVANYGHGKSHLALALANYFGRATDSAEVQELYPKIESAIGDKTLAATYREFKQNRGEFLLIRLRGDRPQSLHAQFLAGLERGLAEHDATRGAKLPFWHDEAARILSTLTPAEVDKANAYLAQHGSELPLLRLDVASHQDVFDRVVETIKAAKGFRPALSEFSLAEALAWAAREFVDSGRLGGILILFDEFSLYIERYGHRTAPAELQDLLNGVDNLRGKAAFLAFAQADPDTTADNLHTLNATSRTSLKKSLTRIERRYQLSTLMESVIDAYLKQSKSAWEAFTQDPHVRGPLHLASDVASDRFRDRYERTLRWSSQQFQRNVTEGCFPLHPITTYLLCNMTLGTVSDAATTRTMLGFVRDHLEEKQPQPAFVDGRPNWVLPIALVDYFEGRFPGSDHNAYANALRAAGADVTAEETAVLKALFLQQLAGVKPRLKEDQRAFLAQAAGLDEARTKATLRALSDRGAILWEPIRKTYSLFAPTADPGRLERIIQPKVERLKFDINALKELNATLAGKIVGLTFGSKPIQVDWGHDEDWRAYEQIIDFERFDAKNLRESVLTTHFGPKGEFVEGERSYVFWLLARTDGELEQLRDGAQAVIDEAFTGDWPVPVVAVMPANPQPDLIRAFQRRQALGQLTNTEKEEIGQEVLRAADARANADLISALRALRGDHDQPFDIPREVTRCIVPKSYRARVQAMQRATLSRIVRECYEWAYPFRPPEFDRRYRVAAQGGANFKKAVTKIAAQLFHGRSRSLPEVAVGGDASMMRDIFNKYLRDDWKLLHNPDYGVQPPAAPGVRRAWDLLEKTFAPGGDGSRLSKVLVTLLNPPYGFDYNTALLLFAAWVGYNGSDVQISQGGRMVKVDTFDAALAKSAKDFFKQVHDNVVNIWRRDLNDVERDIRAKLDGYAGRSYMAHEAANQVSVFRAFAEDQRADPKLREQAAAAADRLEASVEAAVKYDTDAAAIHKAIQSADLSQLLDQRKKVGQLQPTDLVKPNAVAPAEIQQAVINRIEAAVNRSAVEFGALDNIGNYEWNRNHLLTDQKKLHAAGLVELAETLDKALAGLDAREKALRVIMNEKPMRDMIERMRTDLPLAALHNQREQLNGLAGYSDSTMALRDDKLARTSAEIARLEKEAHGLAAEIVDCNDQRALRAVLERLMRVSDRYEGTPFTIQLAAAKKLIDQYGNFFGRLADLKANVQTLSGPEDAARLMGDLDDLAAANAGWIGSKQKDMIQTARERVDDQVKIKQEAASKWFAQIEADVNANGNPVRVLEQLQASPPFLTREHRVRLQEFSLQAERRIEQDVVARIEREFLKIHDPKTRRACIERLQQLASVEAGDGRVTR